MPTQRAIPCMWMRGGTSKGGYFLAADLPAAQQLRDRVLLAVMGSPDPRQIDGMGGAHPLTSKVAVISASTLHDCDVDYLFLQVQPDLATVSAAQNCGNILAGVGPFAIERGLVAAQNPSTSVRVHMVNSGGRAVLEVETPGGIVAYDGDTAIDGVPGTHAPVVQVFDDLAGAQCGALLPTGRPVEIINGIACTLTDHGMPVVAMRADAFGLGGNETAADLESRGDLKRAIESIRLAAGPLMRLGDVASLSVPKMILLGPPRAGGLVATRSFIPHRVHESIGVLAALSVATACLLPGSPAAGVAHLPPGTTPGQPIAGRFRIEHPTGALEIELDLDFAAGVPVPRRAAILRTARKLFDGTVFIPLSVWPPDQPSAVSDGATSWRVASSTSPA